MLRVESIMGTLLKTISLFIIYSIIRGNIQQSNSLQGRGWITVSQTIHLFFDYLTGQDLFCVFIAHEAAESGRQPTSHPGKTRLYRALSHSQQPEDPVVPFQPPCPSTPSTTLFSFFETMRSVPTQPAQRRLSPCVSSVLEGSGSSSHALAHTRARTNTHKHTQTHTQRKFSPALCSEIQTILKETNRSEWRTFVTVSKVCYWYVCILLMSWILNQLLSYAHYVPFMRQNVVMILTIVNIIITFHV